jgi:hypothetical protein
MECQGKNCFAVVKGKPMPRHEGLVSRRLCPELGCDFSRAYCDGAGGDEQAVWDVRQHREKAHKHQVRVPIEAVLGPHSR